MVDLRTAYKVVCDKNNGAKPVAGLELERYYAFNVNPGIINSATHLVDKKTGEYKMEHFMSIINESVLKQYDERDFKRLKL